MGRLLRLLGYFVLSAIEVRCSTCLLPLIKLGSFVIRSAQFGTWVGPINLMAPLSQPHAGAAAVLVDELDPTKSNIANHYLGRAKGLIF